MLTRRLVSYSSTSPQKRGALKANKRREENGVAASMHRCLLIRMRRRIRMNEQERNAQVHNCEPRREAAMRIPWMTDSTM